MITSNSFTTHGRPYSHDSRFPLAVQVCAQCDQLIKQGKELAPFDPALILFLFPDANLGTLTSGKYKTGQMSIQLNPTFLMQQIQRAFSLHRTSELPNIISKAWSKLK